jgi:type IV pilus assembly protein PilQ
MPFASWVVLFGLIAGAPLVAASAARAQSQDAPNELQAVDYALLPAGAALVRLTFARPAEAPPNVLVNHYPIYRITFDFPDTVSALGKRLIEVSPRGLRTIQLVQSGTRTRVVLNLDRPFIFDTVLRGTVLLITLRRPNWGVARPEGEWQDGLAAGPFPHALREVGFERGEAGEGRIFVEVSDAAVPVEIHRQANNVVVEFLHTLVPRSLVRRLDAQDFGTPISRIDTYPVAGNARIAVEVTGAADVSVFQFNRRLFLIPHP